jgi:hypothetical protein
LEIYAYLRGLIQDSNTTFNPKRTLSAHETHQPIQETI